MSHGVPTICSWITTPVENMIADAAVGSAFAIGSTGQGCPTTVTVLLRLALAVRKLVQSVTSRWHATQSFFARVLIAGNFDYSGIRS